MSFKVGTKVNYTPFKDCDESLIINGVVKSHNDLDLTTVFVVFNCANDLKNYKDYTAQSTKISQLKEGWV